MRGKIRCWVALAVLAVAAAVAIGALRARARYEITYFAIDRS